jgi:hypothetical protein
MFRVNRQPPPAARVDNASVDSDRPSEDTLRHFENAAERQNTAQAFDPRTYWIDNNPFLMNADLIPKIGPQLGSGIGGGSDTYRIIRVDAPVDYVLSESVDWLYANYSSGARRALENNTAEPIAKPDLNFEHGRATAFNISYKSPEMWAYPSSGSSFYLRVPDAQHEWYYVPSF